jgi:N6-adenosine-specific RNA methylase IME4
VPRYATVLADPPWHYERFISSPTSRNGAPRGDGKPVVRDLPYESMTVTDIAGLPVGQMAAEDAVLFLWTTNRYLPAAFSVIEAWGFEYRQTLVWRKTGNPSPFPASIAPVHAEFLLLGRRGTVSTTPWPSSVVEAPAPNCGAHSAKPEVFIDLIEQACPGPYVELFARRARFGWDYWGNQSLGTAEMEAA